MRQVRAALLVAMVLLGLGLWGVVPTLSQGAGVRYFFETGHNVQGEFLAFFNQHGGEEVFGLPRTEEFYLGQLKVQYFQRARMELHPENAPSYRVQLSLLGDLLGYRSPGIPTPALSVLNSYRRYYPETGHTLCYAFLTYYDTHGGLDVFGYPITELTNEGGRVVQYFQRGKMEWHPENPISSQIVLANLGDEHIQRTNLSPLHLRPVGALTQADQSAAGSAAPGLLGPAYIPISSDVSGSPGSQPNLLPLLPTPRPLAELRVAASVKYPITGQGGYQTVYVRAIDELDRAVSGAAVEAVVHFRDGDRMVQGNNTDAAGCSSLAFGIGHPPPGYTVVIDVRVTYGGRTQTVAVSFIPWW